MKRLLTVSALTLGLGIALAPTASAQEYVPEAPFVSYSQYFVTPVQAEAWTGSQLVTVSPFGADNIYCASWHGMRDCYQLDAEQRQHDLVQVSAISPRLYVYNPF
jgi:hypothetical protein